MPSPSNERSPRVARWLAGALLTSGALAACTTSVVSSGGTSATSGGGGTGGTDDWSGPPQPGFTDAGVPIVCMPAGTSTCYSGPPGTLGVGSCAPGTRVCNADGTAFGPCTGDVAAREDACGAPGGLDCQGAAVCAVKAAWSHGFQGEQQDGVTALHVDGNGETLIAGFSQGTLDLGTGPLAFGPSGDMMFGFLASFDGAGAPVWSRALGATSSTTWTIESMTRDAAGAIYLGGHFREYGPLDLGDGPMTTKGGLDAFVAKLDATGKVLWSRQYGSDGDEIGLYVGVDGAGNVALTGSYAAAGEAAYQPPDGAGVFVTRWSASGDPLWSKRFAAISINEPVAAALAPSGDVYLAGPFSGTVDLGGGPLTAASKSSLYVARLDALGNHLWSKSFGGKGTLDASAVRVDGAGNLTITGTYEGWADLGGAPLTPFSLAQPYVARLDVAGNHLWSRTLGGSSTTGNGVTLALGSGGDVTVAGTFTSMADVTAGLAADRMFLAHLTSAGVPTWGTVHGGTPQTSVDVAALGLDPAGRMIVAGGYHGIADFGTGPLPDSHGWEAMFVAKIAP